MIAPLYVCDAPTLYAKNEPMPVLLSAVFPAQELKHVVRSGPFAKPPAQGSAIAVTEAQLYRHLEVGHRKVEHVVDVLLKRHSLGALEDRLADAFALSSFTSNAPGLRQTPAYDGGFMLFDSLSRTMVDAVRFVAVVSASEGVVSQYFSSFVVPFEHALSTALAHVGAHQIRVVDRVYDNVSLRK